MSAKTTRPDALGSGGAGGTTLVGASSLVAALSDDLDTSYIILDNGDHPFVEFAEPTGIPAGAKVKAGRLRARAKNAGVSSGGALVLNWGMSDPASASNISGTKKDAAVPGFSMTTYTALADEQTDPHVTPTNIGANVYAHGPSTAFPVHLAALYFDTIYVVKPTVSVTSPSATVTGDTTPPIVWTSTFDSDGGTQTAFEVKLFTSAQANPTAASSSNESGIVASGAATWTPTLPLADGSWFAYVRVAQTVNGETHWSDWGSGTAGSFASFTVTIDRPAVPTLTLTVESASGRIKVLQTANAGAATTSKFEAQVSNNGTTWVPLRTAAGDGTSTPSGGTATEYDYEAPIGGVRSFRIRAYHTYPEGYAVSAWSATQTATWTSTDWWVKNLADPTLSVAVLPRSQPSSTRAGRMGVFQPLGAQYPIAVLDQRSAPSGQIVFRFDSDSARNAFETLVDRSSVVLIQAPSGVNDWPDRYCALGDYERERALDSSTAPWTFDSVAWTEVARP